MYDVVTHGDNDEYIELEYIESTGTQYIDTEFKPNQDTRVVMDFENSGDYSAMTTSLCPFFGARNASSSAVFALWVGTKTYPHYGNVVYSKNGYFSVDINTRLVYDFNKNVVNIGDTQITCLTGTFTTNYNLYLFTINNYGNVETRRVSGKLYSCKIYDNGLLIRDYVPVINSNGVCGLFDKVNNKFYPSVTDNFIRGNTNSNYTAIQTQSTATHKIKRDTQYVVEAGGVDKYITPEKQLFTAKNYSRTVDVLYEEAPIDLSMFNIYGSPILQNTANCYVVNKTGSYMVPLVFGNAIKNGVANPVAYTNNGDSDCCDFVDYAGNVISSPYIETVSGAVASASLSVADTDNVFTNIRIINNTPCKYLKFDIANIPGTGANGVLSVKDASGVIMWSWHIWVWPYDLTPIKIINEGGFAYNILPVNLATKLDTADSIEVSSGWKNWFYQFGRPVPQICKSYWNVSSRHTNYGDLEVTSANVAPTISYGIVNPSTFYKRDGSNNYYSWFQTGSSKTYNLWDAACTETGRKDNNVVKTVYDPCPVGFKVPNGNTFTGFESNDTLLESEAGYHFKRHETDYIGTFFPFSDYIDAESGKLHGTSMSNSVWSSAANTRNNVYVLYFDNVVGYSSTYTAYRSYGLSIRPVQDAGIEGQNKRTKIRIDQTFADPQAMITRIIDEGGIEAIRSNSHRYTGTFANGVMTLKQLDDTDGTRYVNGTDATIDMQTLGSDVWMKLPQFHWKCTEHATDVWDFEVVFGAKPDDTYKTWDGNDLIGAYESYISSSKIYSASARLSSSNASQATFKAYARARGEGFTLVKWNHHCMMAMLYYTMYGNTNCQSKIGVGESSNAKRTGVTDSLGMTDTVAGGNGDSNSINFWGLENWWGNKFEWMDNIVVDARVWKVTEDDGTVRQAGTGGSSDGWISKLLLGENIDLIPKAVSGSETTGFCDYYYQSSSDSRVVRRSGNFASTVGGVAFVDAHIDSSTANSSGSARLAFRGNIVIES